MDQKKSKKNININKGEKYGKINKRNKCFKSSRFNNNGKSFKKTFSKQRKKCRSKKEELPFKDALESAGRLSYFTEVFEGISLADQKIEVEGIVNPKESYFFNNGREIAEKLVRNNIANMENYADFCKVETRKTRNGR